MLTMSVLFLFGCGKKADENKPISEVKAEAEKMSAADLKAIAMKYKDAIEAKKADVEKITAKLKEIPVTQMLGEQAKQLKGDIDNLNKSVTALRERFQIYYDQLKTKGGDLSGLQI
jgi:ATP-dependent Clp protease ATP-binding subunit ClpA